MNRLGRTNHKGGGWTCSCPARRAPLAWADAINEGSES